MRLDEIAVGTEAIAPDMRGAELQALFKGNPHLRVVAVVDGNERPVGMIERTSFFQFMGGKFGHSLYTRRPVSMIMNDCPIIVDVTTKLTSIIASYVANAADTLADGLICTRDEKFVGIASREQVLLAICKTSLQDIGRLEAATAARERARILLESVVESIPTILALRDADTGLYRFINRTAEALLGQSRSQIVGQNVAALDVLFGPTGPTGVVRFDRADGERLSLRVTTATISDPQDARPLAMCIAEDISEKIYYEQKITYLAHHDSLTGLPNRRRFDVDLGKAMQALGNGIVFNLICIDLDRFKPVNDRYGHAAGDQLLCEAAARLTECLSSDARASRLGGDEFAVIQEGNASLDDARHLAAGILNSLRAPFVINGQTVSIGASIGITHASDPDKSRAHILEEADRALYAAKRSGGSAVRVFSADMTSHDQSLANLAEDLATAIFREEISAYFQPIYNTRDGKVGGFECLARWHHPQEGPIAPERFIPIAEATGLIGDLGQLILDRACMMLAMLPPDIYVSINISPIQFNEDRVVEKIRDIMVNRKIDPRRLVFEITENVFLTHTKRNIDLLNNLKDLGVVLSVDDFGTGYSSFGHIEAFMPDKIKIDRSFVARLHSSRGARAIISAVLSLAQNLGIEVTAEGVETFEQFEYLVKEGCHEIQGYFVGKATQAANWQEINAQTARTLDKAKDQSDVLTERQPARTEISRGATVLII